jgi:hypothetical protein
MANLTSAAGDNGASGATTGVSGGNTAILLLCYNPQGFSAVAASVYSELRIFVLRHPVECDSPVRSRLFLVILGSPAPPPVTWRCSRRLSGSSYSGYVSSIPGAVVSSHQDDDSRVEH